MSPKNWPSVAPQPIETTRILTPDEAKVALKRINELRAKKKPSFEKHFNNEVTHTESPQIKSVVESVRNPDVNSIPNDNSKFDVKVDVSELSDEEAVLYNKLADSWSNLQNDFLAALSKMTNLYANKKITFAEMQSIRSEIWSFNPKSPESDPKQVLNYIKNIVDRAS